MQNYILGWVGLLVFFKKLFDLTHLITKYANIHVLLMNKVYNFVLKVKVVKNLVQEMLCIEDHSHKTCKLQSIRLT